MARPRRARSASALLTVTGLLLAAAQSAHAQSRPNAPGPRVAPTGRVLVTLDSSRPARAQDDVVRSLLARTGARATGPRVPEIGLVTLRPEIGDTIAGLVRALRGDARVTSVRRENRMRLRLTPNDPALSTAEPRNGALALQWAVGRQNAFAGWDVARGTGAVVAVIDTGVDVGHPDLAGKVEAIGPSGDPDGHGTHVSSLACASTNNGVGMAGMGFDCRVMSLRSDLSDASIAAAIVVAADRGAHAINMSFGDAGEARSPAIAAAVDYAVARNVVPVAAAADDPIEEQGEPANLIQPTGTGANLDANRGLVVTAAAANDQRAGFAGRGTQISIGAYGDDGPGGPPGLFGAFPGNRTPRETGVFPAQPCRCRTTLNGDDRYGYLAGTSMAAPQVAALAAELRAHNADLSGPEVVKIVKQTARRAGGWDAELGWGIIDAGAALRAAHVIDKRPPSSRARATGRVRAKRTRSGRPRARVLVRYTASDAAAPGIQPAGLRHVSLYRAIGNGKLKRIGTMTGGSKRVALKAGRTYRFATRALDRRGNAEPLPARADATVKVLKPKKKRRR